MRPLQVLSFALHFKCFPLLQIILFPHDLLVLLQRVALLLLVGLQVEHFKNYVISNLINYDSNKINYFQINI